MNKIIESETPKGIRLAKAMADAGLCSRREAERWIEAGRVALNGQRVKTPATLVTPTDTVEVDGQEIGAKQPCRVFVYNKPVGELCTADDPQGRPTVFNAPVMQQLPRVVSVGRLDANSEGMLLLTTDGAFAGDLMKSNLQRIYRVRVFGGLKPEHMQQAKRGMYVKGERFAPVLIEPESGHTQQGKNAWYRFTLTEGKNREIRRIVEHFGSTVNRLQRVQYGPIVLNNLKTGEARELSPLEIQAFHRALYGRRGQK